MFIVHIVPKQLYNELQSHKPVSNQTKDEWGIEKSTLRCWWGKNLEKKQDSVFVQILLGFNKRRRKKDECVIRISSFTNLEFAWCEPHSISEHQHSNLFCKDEEDYLEDDDVHQKVKPPINRESSALLLSVGVLNKTSLNNQWCSEESWRVKHDV